MYTKNISGDDEEVLRGYFDALSEGGTVTMPLDEAPWGDVFGMLTDKIGVHWMVNVSKSQA
jgi:PhnB protein